MNKTAFLNALLYTIASGILAFLVLPIVVVIPVSFNPTTVLSFPPSGLSFRWYDAFLRDTAWLRSFGTSLQVALLATGISLILGTLAALGLARLGTQLRQAFYGFFLGPLIVPVMVTTVALYYTYQRTALHGSLVGLATAHALLGLPYVVINVGLSLDTIDPQLFRAAAALGAQRWTIFRTITLPLIVPGLVSGAIFAFVTSFDEVVLSLFLSGLFTKTLPVRMWEVVRVEMTPVIAVASVFFIALTMVLFTLVEILRRRTRLSAAALVEG
jgi:putative spermidine/putrescine transport system permease protein